MVGVQHGYHEGVAKTGFTAVIDPAKFSYDLDVSDSSAIKKTFPNCKNNVDTEYWELVGSKHLPTPSNQFTSDLLDFLLSHTKTSN